MEKTKEMALAEISKLKEWLRTCKDKRKRMFIQSNIEQLAKELHRYDGA